MSVGPFLGPVELHTVALTFGSSGHRFDLEVIKMHGVLCHGGFAFSLLEAGFTMGEIDFYVTAAATHRFSSVPVVRISRGIHTCFGC